MEIDQKNLNETSDLSRREIAAEIHNTIISSLEVLLSEPGVSEEHSLVKELRQEKAMAERALLQYDENNLLRAVA